MDVNNSQKLLQVKENHNQTSLYTMYYLKHKDSFGNSENHSKIFYAEILISDHDYEGKSARSNGLF